MSDFDRLVRLADDLYSRYEAGANHGDLGLCIVHYRSALTQAKSSSTLSDDIRGKLLSNLANALSIRFQRHGDIADLNHSVECHLTALDFRPPGHPGRANTLSNFATTLLVRYGHLSMQKDIELAIEHFSTALSMLPSDGRLIPLMNYASALFSRFQHSGDVSDLNAAIRQYRAVADSAPAENRPTSYYNLANALLSRFKLETDPKDLELCIKYSAIALHGMSNGHPDSFLAQSCFSTALVRRYELYGAAEDLQSAVEHFKTALDLRSAQDSAQFVAFYDLADALVMRYKLHSDIPDLELAIEHYRTAFSLLSPNHKDEGVMLDNLGSALFLRFSRLGGLNDLEEAIQKHYCALVIHSRDSSRRVNTLEALGACLDARFQQFRDPEDLHTAIDLYNEALTETSHDYPRRAAILTRSAGSLETRFRLHGGIINLDRSISYCCEALELLPSHHSDRATSYRVLVSSLILRFEETGDEFDLDEAYLHCSACMNVRHPSDSIRAACNLLFARILKVRVLPWEPRDIESIFQHLHFAKDLCTLSHPLISDVYAELASTYYLRYLVEQRSSDLHDALGHHELSMSVAGGSTWPAFRATLEWVSDAEAYGHQSGVNMYRNALRLVYRHIMAIRSPELRQCVARRYIADLAYDGASFALRFNERVDAVEVLEGGRSILWSQLVRAKTCLDELRLMDKHGASLADDYERLSLQLEHLPQAPKSTSSKDVKHLLKEKEVVVEQIRRLDGFKYFLKPTPYSEFDKAALDGPVVILNAGRHTCDALLLVYNRSPIHVSLSRVTPQDASQMAARFRALTWDPTSDEDADALERLLSDLWYLVVSPIVERLLRHAPKGSRLWWCPARMFTAMPLHAAGPYKQNEAGLPHFYVSSYAPTLQALIRARSGRATEEVGLPGLRRPSMRFLKRSRPKHSPDGANQPACASIVAIGIDGSGDNDGGAGAGAGAGHVRAASLSTCRELDLVHNRVPSSIPFRRVEGDDATSDAVLVALREPFAWVHLACPTSLNAAQPCRSRFTTSGGTLSLYDISQARPRAEFAFLSGQCVGRNDGRRRDAEDTLEETMHVATSLQYCGVRSVVGTLWPVDERVMRHVVDAFYDHVVSNAGSMQCTNAAQSLNEALKSVGKGIPLAQRIAFVHVGI